MGQAFISRRGGGFNLSDLADYSTYSMRHTMINGDVLPSTIDMDKVKAYLVAGVCQSGGSQQDDGQAAFAVYTRDGENVLRSFTLHGLGLPDLVVNYEKRTVKVFGNFLNSFITVLY